MTVAHLRGQVHDLDERYDRAPSMSLLAETGQCLGQITFLRRSAPTSRIRRELRIAEAEAAILMGQLVWDASQRRDHRTAHQYLDQAGEAAREVGDPALEGLALLRKSFITLYGEKNPLAGLAITTRTADVVGDASQVLSGLATLHIAEANAMLGRRADCERALIDADTKFGRITSCDAALDLFSPTQHGRLAGSCYLFLGKPNRAQPILETVAGELRDRSKSRAIVLGNLGLAHIRQRQLDGALTAMHQAVDIVESTWGGGGITIMFDACRELRPWRHTSQVSDLYDRVMNLMSTTTSGTTAL